MSARARMRVRGVVALSVSLVGAVVGAVACRKPPPVENVYTGRTASPGGTSKAPVETVTPPPPAPTDEVPPPPVNAFSKQALLTAIADCTLSEIRTFEGVAAQLRDAARANRDAPTDGTAQTLRDAWVAAIAVWQELEVLSFGPAGHAAVPGGKDFRDQIYSWPSVSRCKVDEQIVSSAYAAPDFATSLVNGRGLHALEYLAYYGGADNGCSSFSTINGQGTWAALGATELAKRKAAYAFADAEDVVRVAAALRNAWDPAGANFHGQLTTAGSGSTTFASAQDAFNAITEAIFYVEKTVKDLKLGRPLGYIECASTTCPDSIESTYARISTAHIRRNLAGFRKVFQGCGDKGAGFGFDDWLIDVGAGDLATRMVDALVNTQAEVDALDPPLEQALTTEAGIAKVAHVHASLRALTDPLKTEMITVLNLELPKSSEGDND